MKGNFGNGFKFKWNRFKKQKWFFPAMYIGIVAIVLMSVVVYQKIGSEQVQENAVENNVAKDDLYKRDDAQEVLQEEEMVQLPVDSFLDSEIVTKFFDVDADEEDLERAVTFYNNRYYESKAIHVKSKEDTPFDVIASVSGTVKDVKEDPLLGNIVIMSHDDGIETYYASLAETNVKEGDEVKQGGVIGTAGKNVFSADSGVHVHFEIHKDGVEVNPEQFLDEPFQNLVEASIEEVPFEENVGTDEEDEPSDSDNDSNNDENKKEEEQEEEQPKNDDLLS